MTAAVDDPPNPRSAAGVARRSGPSPRTGPTPSDTDQFSAGRTLRAVGYRPGDAGAFILARFAEGPALTPAA